MNRCSLQECFAFSAFEFLTGTNARIGLESRMTKKARTTTGTGLMMQGVDLEVHVRATFKFEDLTRLGGSRDFE